jgi:hypothetical protein
LFSSPAVTSGRNDDGFAIFGRRGESAHYTGSPRM